MKWYINITHPITVVGLNGTQAAWIDVSARKVTYSGKSSVHGMLSYLMSGWEHVQSDLAPAASQICVADGWYAMPSFIYAMELANKLELTQYASNLDTVQELRLDEHIASQCPEVPINLVSVMKFLGYPIFDCYFTANGIYIGAVSADFHYNKGILLKNMQPIPYLVKAVEYPGISRPVYIIQPKNETLSRKHLYM